MRPVRILYSVFLCFFFQMPACPLFGVWCAAFLSQALLFFLLLCRGIFPLQTVLCLLLFLCACFFCVSALRAVLSARVCQALLCIVLSLRVSALFLLLFLLRLAALPAAFFPFFPLFFFLVPA